MIASSMEPMSDEIVGKGKYRISSHERKEAQDASSREGIEE